MEIEVREEMRINSTIGQVKAIDGDLGENSDIAYAIIDGNDNKIFEVIHLSTWYRLMSLFSSNLC